MNAHSVSEQLRLLPDYLGHHLALTLLALVVGIVICIPLGALVTRSKPLQWPTLTVAGVLQTIPGLALLALMVPLLGTIGFVPAFAPLPSGSWGRRPSRPRWAPQVSATTSSAACKRRI